MTGLLILFISTVAFADDVPVNRIYQAKRDFHYYTPNRAAWKVINSGDRKESFINHPKYCKDTGDVFVASDVELEGTIELHQWRGSGENYQYYYGTELPEGFNLKHADYDDDSRIWVWKEEAEGLVPVYGSVRPNGQDAYFTTNMNEYKARFAADWKVQRIRRVDLGIVFYAKPPVLEKEQKPK